VSQFVFVQQPMNGTVADVIRDALLDSRYTHLQAAVSYVMSSGVRELEQQLATSTVRKRWLTAFDWCRSEPAALDALHTGARAEVRIHDGATVVAKPYCAPSRSFHPKAFLFTGPRDALLVSGSANLSRNGLTTGVEFDSVIRVQRVSAQAPEWELIDRSRRWFNRQWREASQLNGLAPAYRHQHARRPVAAAVLDFDDPRPSARARGFGADDLARIAQSQVMWIETGIRDAAGTQLMLRPLTRVFFGFDATAIPRMTLIGHVAMSVGKQIVPDRSLEYAHNSMDRINLPGVLPGWPARYDGKIIVFRKAARGGQVIFDLSIPSSSDLQALKSQSKRGELYYTMSGGREFGFI
jgi:HKD family nuclease